MGVDKLHQTNVSQRTTLCYGMFPVPFQGCERTYWKIYVMTLDINLTLRLQFRALFGSLTTASIIQYFDFRLLTREKSDGPKYYPLEWPADVLNFST